MPAYFRKVDAFARSHFGMNGCGFGCFGCFGGFGGFG
jgi:hypothetical protein